MTTGGGLYVREGHRTDAITAALIAYVRLAHVRSEMCAWRTRAA
jgi:hypothetical protein